jgi:hypothetical protein
MTLQNVTFKYNKPWERPGKIEIVGLLKKKLKPDIILRILDAIIFKIFYLSSLSM